MKLPGPTAGLLAVVLIAVALRYSELVGITGSDELASWLNIALTFIGFPLVASRALAMRFDLISSRLRDIRATLARLSLRASSFMPRCSWSQAALPSSARPGEFPRCSYDPNGGAMLWRSSAAVLAA
ncbi:hypothetical protein CHELA1G11_20544 [Hyphomicrobiales bacterium]|nr:hypothetical protein CHELA1G11_20544 [Hyphomicrobiales bacterium]CAH1690716.1 hypothetical protein CHELA1G2_20857 [Hyphomicrobiales bacterium]